MNKKYLVFTSVGIGCFVASLIFYRFATGQSEGTVIRNEGTDVSTVKSANVELKKYDNQYFSVLIPGELKLKSSSLNTTQSILAQYAFWSQDTADQRQISITVGESGGSGIDDIPFVKQRLRDSGYISASSQQNKFVIQKKDGSEYAIFITKDYRYAAIVVSGEGELLAALSDTAERVWQNFTWK